MADFDLQTHITLEANSNIAILDIVEVFHQETLTTAVDIAAGKAVKIGSAGKWIAANATTPTLSDLFGIVVKTAKAGQGVTVIRKGILAGWDLSGVAYWAKVYLKDDGGLTGTPGTETRLVGHVVPLRGQKPGDSPMKGILIEIAEQDTDT